MEMSTDLRSVQQLAEMAAAEATRRARAASYTQPTGQENWHVFCTASGFREVDEKKELDARRLLGMYNYEYYSPKIRKLVLVPDRELSRKERQQKIKRLKPKLVDMLPGYILIRLDRRRSDWRDVFFLVHIRGMIYSDEAGEPLPVIIQEYEIQRLRSYEIDGAIPEKIPVKELAYKVGQAVKLTEGAWAGHIALIKELPDKPVGDIDDDDRVKVQTLIFGSERLIEVPLGNIGKL